MGNNYVRGKYDSDINKIAYNEYANKINKSVTNVKDAIDNAKEILGIEEIDGVQFSNDFWSSIFIQKEDKDDDLGSVKLCINTTEPLYSELPISKTLEAFATNILDKDSGGLYDSENKKIKLYTSKEEFKKALKEKGRLYNIALKNGGDNINTSDVNQEFVMLMIPRNYKKVKTYDLTNINKIDKEFGKDYPVIHEYCNSYNVLNNKRKRLKGLIEDEYIDCKEELIKELKMTVRQLGKIKEDINTCLMELVRPIIWKQPLKDEGCVDYDYFDFFDKEQVKELLRVKREDNDFQDDLSCIIYDLNNLISQCTFNSNQEKILNMWRNGKTQQQIANELETTKQNINYTINTIINIIVKKYEEIYSDWYYLNISKGKYKKCNKCGEIKLIQQFDIDKNNKNGYKNLCKECRKNK